MTKTFIEQQSRESGEELPLLLGRYYYVMTGIEAISTE